MNLTRSIYTVIAASILSAGIANSGIAGPLTDMMKRNDYVRVGDLEPFIDKNRLPKEFLDRSMILSGRYCEGLPYSAPYYHVHIDLDDVDDSGDHSKFRAFSYVSISSNKLSAKESLEVQPYIVTGKYLDGTLHIETAKPVIQMDEKDQFQPILEATPGNYQVRMFSQGRTEITHLFIGKQPEGASCISAEIEMGTRLTKKERKDLVATAKKSQKSREQQATANTMVLDTIQISGKQKRKKVEKLLRKKGAKFLKSENKGVDIITYYDVSETIPGISKLQAVFTPIDGKEYLKNISLEIIKKPYGTPREELTVVQMRNALVKKYGQPTQEWKNGDALWERPDGVLAVLKVKGGGYLPAGGDIHYFNQEMLELSKQLKAKQK